ncbi:coiled-coil domain-containing protein 39 [Stomoxys calcitrans]|uniref:coiled-coil domain-containing protein 39 n=1 Tax=Stomoxys calcitrans TaxID=35570 RepID=UPI0027E2A429|nr:coiled-coil domain-containing protein 39 [Stomoxys calcitrans]
MDHEIIIKAMQAMHWNSASEIPMANEENRLILDEIRALQEKKEETLEYQQQTEERLKKLHEHSKNAEITINHNLKLLNAYQADVITEAHLYKLALRENSKLKEDLRNVEKEWKNNNKYMDRTEKEMCVSKQTIDNLTNRIKWAKTALIEWRQAMEDGSKGYQLIEMYYKDDQLRAKQQNQKREKLNAEIDKCRQILIRLYDEQKTLECNLECTANLYRTAHAERRTMIDTWKLAAAQMSQREKDIRNSEMALIELRNQAQKAGKDYKATDDRLNEVIENNRTVETAIELLNSETSDMKEQMQMLIDSVALKTNEVELIQKELQNLASRVQQQRAENRRSSKSKEDRLIELDNMEKVVAKLEERLRSMADKNMSAQQRLQALEDLMDAEDRAQKAVNKETDRINGLIYRSQLQLAKFREDGLALTVDNRGIIATTSAIEKNMELTEKELRKQTECSYELSFKILQVERRILHLQGSCIDPEVEQRNQFYVTELEERLSKLQKVAHTMQQQNKKLEDDMRKLTITYNNDMDQLEAVNFKIKEAQVYCEGGVKRVKEETKRNQELIVELSILKMRANEFEEEITRCEDSAYNLAKHRMHLNRTIKDRMVEIRSQMEILNLKRKHQMEELSTLRADIGERKKHIEAVKARFELTSKLLGVNDDGTMVTATQLKVETAQEKQMLLDEGNELNEAVLNAEREIEALQNTLALLNNSNDAFRKQIQKVQDGEEASAELKSLQMNYCASLNKLRTLRQELQEQELKLQESVKQRDELDKLLSREAKKRCDDADFLCKLQKELQDQANKLTRADRELKTALKALKQRAISEEFLRLYNKDLDLRDLEKRNLGVLNQLGEIAYTDYVLGPKIARHILDRGLKMPHMLQKSRSSLSYRSDTSFDMMSYSSSKEIFTSRSSQSETSEIKQTSSARLSVISLELPSKKK